MPKPCSKPLRQNPFESYRDPVTGQWKVRYPASTLPASPCSVQGVQVQGVQVQSVQAVQAEAKPIRLWKKTARKTKVA